MHSIKIALSRYGWFTAGVLLNAFGVALITKAALGTSPISSLPYVLSLRFPVTLGQFTFLMNMLFILAQVLLLRKDFRPVQLLQVAVNVVFSLFIDVSMGLLSWMEVGVLPMRLLALVVGCAVLGFGISVEVAPRVLMVPGEGIVQAIAVVTGRQFGNVKTAFDATLVSTALLLSLLFFHQLQGLLFADVFVQGAAELVGDVVFAVGKGTGAAEAVHNGAGGALDAGLHLHAVNGTVPPGQGVARLKQGDLQVRPLLQQLIGGVDSAGASAHDQHIILHSHFLLIHIVIHI